MAEIDKYEALNYISQRMADMSSCDELPPQKVRLNAAMAIDLDVAFMQSSGVFDGDEYDDYAAFDYLSKNLTKQNIDEDFIEDYMEVMEMFLNEKGIISWDGK